MNVALLREIKADILARPKAFNMAVFANECGTVCCIAGKAVLKTSPRDFKLLLRGGETSAWSMAAEEALDLDHVSAQRLFLSIAWPDEFFIARLRATNSQEHAEVAARRIDHFIATEGRE